MTPGRNPTELHELLRQQESLRDVIESISSQLELRPLLTQIVQHACQLLGAARGTIGLVDKYRNVIRTEAVYKMPPDELGMEMSPGVGLAGQVLQTQAPVILGHYGQVGQPVQMGMLEDSVIGLPIFWRGDLIGFFGIGADTPHVFTEQDLETLTIYARHAAVAIENARLFSGMQRALEETQLLYETSRRISTALDIDEVVAAYLEQVAVRADYACTIVLYEFNGEGRRTYRVTRGYWTPEEGRVLMRQRMPYYRDNLDDLLDAGQTVVIADVNGDGRVPAGLRALQNQSGRPALALIPLFIHGKRIGLVVLSYAAVHEWSESDLRPYQMTAVQLATAIDGRQQQRLLYQWGQQMAVVDERQRLARELHDAVTQLVFSVTLIAQSIAPAWRRDPAEGERRVARLLELSQAALAEMRALLFELRPVESPIALSSAIMPGLVRVQREGLVSALQDHVDRLVQAQLEIILRATAYEPQSQHYEEALFRIAQESLNNIVKHAQADCAWITLWVSADGVYLTVKDDGVGFSDPITDNNYSGFGLGTMRSRAEAVGGLLEIMTRPGHGTTIAVTLPTGEKKDERPHSTTDR